MADTQTLLQMIKGIGYEPGERLYDRGAVDSARGDLERIVRTLQLERLKKKLEGEQFFGAMPGEGGLLPPPEYGEQRAGAAGMEARGEIAQPPMGPTFRPSAATNLMPSIGEPPTGLMSQLTRARDPMMEPLGEMPRLPYVTDVQPDPIGRQIIRPQEQNPFRPRATDLMEGIGEMPPMRPEGTLPERLLEGLRAHARTSTPRALEPGPEGPPAGAMGPPPPGMAAMGAAPPMAGRAPLPGGMDDTRFRGPTGRMAPEVDLGGAVLPGAADTRLFREPPQTAPQGGGGEMDPQRRLELMRAARMFREGASEFADIPNAADFLLARHGVPMRDYRVRDEDLRADEERLRRGDFENPNSPASIGARQMLSQATGQEVPETMSAAAIMALNPMFDRLIRAQYAGQSAAIAGSREARAQRIEAREGGTGAASIEGLPQAAKSRVFQQRNAFRSNARVAALQTGISEAQAVKELLKSNPLAAQAAIIKLARASGEKGPLSESDIAAWRGGPGIKGILHRIETFAGSELPDEMKGWMNDIADSIIKNYSDILAAEADSEASALSQAYPQVPKERFAEFLRGGEAPSGTGGRAPGTGGTGNGQAGAGEVWVKRGDEVRGPVSRAEAERMLRDRAIDAIVD